MEREKDPFFPGIAGIQPEPVEHRERQKRRFPPKETVISGEDLERLPKSWRRFFRSIKPKEKNVLCLVCAHPDRELRRLTEKLREKGFTFREAHRLTGFSLGTLHRHEKHSRLET